MRIEDTEYYKIKRIRIDFLKLKCEIKRGLLPYLIKLNDFIDKYATRLGIKL